MYKPLKYAFIFTSLNFLVSLSYLSSSEPENADGQYQRTSTPSVSRPEPDATYTSFTRAIRAIIAEDKSDYGPEIQHIISLYHPLLAISINAVAQAEEQVYKLGMTAKNQAQQGKALEEKLRIANQSKLEARASYQAALKAALESGPYDSGSDTELSWDAESESEEQAQDERQKMNLAWDLVAKADRKVKESRCTYTDAWCDYRIYLGTQYIADIVGLAVLNAAQKEAFIICTVASIIVSEPNPQ